MTKQKNSTIWYGMNVYIYNKCAVKYNQCFTQTSLYSDEKVELFYEYIARATIKNKYTYSIVMGDFNTKLGKQQDETEEKIYKISFDQRI